MTETDLFGGAFSDYGAETEVVGLNGLGGKDLFAHQGRSGAAADPLHPYPLPAIETIGGKRLDFIGPFE